MPPLSEVRYSREATIAAVAKYFEFLARMCVDKAPILWLPNKGWPNIRVDNLGNRQEEADEVVLLLRHLPYLTYWPNGSDIDAGIPDPQSSCVGTRWLSRAPCTLKALRNTRIPVSIIAGCLVEGLGRGGLSKGG